MDILDLKETLVLKVSQVLLDNKATPELRGFQVLRERSDLRERRVPMENQAYRECQEPTDLRATQEKKGRQERKETWDLLVLKGQSDILDLEV